MLLVKNTIKLGTKPNFKMQLKVDNFVSEINWPLDTA